MKKNFGIRILAAGIAISFTASALAQSSSGNAASFDHATLVGSVKVAGDADKLTLYNLSEEHSRVFRSFTRDFPNASEIEVSSDNEFIHIYCIVDKIPTRVMYYNGGKSKRIIRTYHVDRLDPNVRSLVQAHYPSYSIFSVTEIFAKGKTAYMVYIESDKTWKIIKVVDGEMNLDKEYLKY
jgi:hypothetical protein